MYPEVSKSPIFTPFFLPYQNGFRENSKALMHKYLHSTYYPDWMLLVQDMTQEFLGLCVSLMTFLWCKYTTQFFKHFPVLFTLSPWDVFTLVLGHVSIVVCINIPAELFCSTNFWKLKSAKALRGIDYLLKVFLSITAFNYKSDLNMM